MRRLYGMYLAVLAARMDKGADEDTVEESRVFPLHPPSGRRGAQYPWAQLVGPLPRPPPHLPIRALPGVPRNWRWGAPFRDALLRWASRLQWRAQGGEVAFAELAPDFEPFAGEALPAPPEQSVRGVTMSPQARAKVLRKALRTLQGYLVSGELLRGAFNEVCRSLVPPGGKQGTGLRARPYFAARGAMRV